MAVLRVIFGDQLSLSVSSLRGCDKHQDTVLMCEGGAEATYVKHHQKKIAFLFSAMRHFAKALTDQQYAVRYIKLDDPNNSGSMTGEVMRALQEQPYERICVTFPGEYRVLQDINAWSQEVAVPVEVLPDDRFICSLDEFSAWSRGKKQLRMEYFYRYMRQRFGILMEDKAPIGGQWNYDSDNRKPPKNDLTIPQTYCAKPDAISREVMTLVADRFAHHFGDVEPFHFAVTRDDALVALAQFIEQRLVNFGDYQDAMLQGEPWMFHSHISFYLNCGLLQPLECVHAAEKAYHEGKAPLNAVEGFIRQIIGWREFVRGMYWQNMPEYSSMNYFSATRALPEFYWTGNTRMNCLHQCVTDTKKYAYAHHIQRLMVLGNFALLAGIAPKAVNEWFLVVYADAYEWVEMPNVTGMVLFADGGWLASKPYAAGGNYIHKMSDYCRGCSYKVTVKHGSKACPFNYLYWDFLNRNRQKLQSNARLGMIYRSYDRMNEDKKAAIQHDSWVFLKALENQEWV